LKAKLRKYMAKVE
jgi:dynein heavy chain 1